MAMIIELNGSGRIEITTKSKEVITIKLHNKYYEKCPLVFLAYKEIKIRNIKREKEELEKIFGKSRSRK